MKITFYDNYWIVEDDGTFYEIRGDKYIGYDIIHNDKVIYSSDNLEECLIWLN